MEIIGILNESFGQIFAIVNAKVMELAEVVAGSIGQIIDILGK